VTIVAWAALIPSDGVFLSSHLVHETPLGPFFFFFFFWRARPGRVALLSVDGAANPRLDKGLSLSPLPSDEAGVSSFPLWTGDLFSKCCKQAQRKQLFFFLKRHFALLFVFERESSSPLFEMLFRDFPLSARSHLNGRASACLCFFSFFKVAPSDLVV